MIHEKIGIGTTVEDARVAAMAQLNVPEYAEVQFEVLEMPVKKTFGLFGGAPAKVRAFYEELPEVIAEWFLKGMLVNMGLADSKISVAKTEGGLEITVETENYGLLIGRRGDTLNALQYLTGLAANRVSEEYFRVTINVGNYREKRERMLTSLAKRTAISVARTGKTVELEPMNPYERRIVHTAVQNIVGATSSSVGEDAERHVVISLAEGFKPTGKPRGFKKPGMSKGGKGRFNNKGGYNKGGYNKGGYKGGYNKGGYNKNAAGADSPEGANTQRPENRQNRPYNPRPNNRPYNNRGDGNSAPRGNRNGYKSDKSYSRPRPAPNAAPQREPKSDSTSAPMYGRIDK